MTPPRPAAKSGALLCTHASNVRVCCKQANSAAPCHGHALPQTPSAFLTTLRHPRRKCAARPNYYLRTPGHRDLARRTAGLGRALRMYVDASALVGNFAALIRSVMICELCLSSSLKYSYQMRGDRQRIALVRRRDSRCHFRTPRVTYTTD
ncbi:hypothetical protein OH77DRAFT_1092684 [Trametes cingulata]|nr:hypothetical protein OH77DRAFT_1092684 [Trametes cingulata]